MHVFQLATEPGLELLQLSVLRVQGLELLLGLLKTQGELAALVVELLDPGGSRRRL